MRILLIGGNGFIGSPLMRELQASRHEVAIFHRGADATAASNTTQISGDRNRLPDFLDQLRQFAPDVIVDLILSSGEQARQLMNVAKKLACRVVALSSMDVYRAWGVCQNSEGPELEALPLTEDARLRTSRSLYPPDKVKMMQGIFSWLTDEYDKIAVEEEVRSFNGTVVRLPVVYGPGDPLHRFFPVLKRCADGRPFILLPDDFAAWRSPRGYVDNVAHAIALACASEKSAGHTYNVCEEPCLSELEWQTRIAKQVDWPGKLIAIPKDLAPEHIVVPGNANQHMVVSSARIRSELGYAERIGVDEAIRQTTKWEQQNPPAVKQEQFDYAAEDAAVASLQE